VRVEHAAEHAAQVLDRLHQPAPPQHRAGEEVVVAAQVFGGRVHDEVHALRERPLVDGRGEGGVDDQVRAGAGIARAAKLRQVGHAQVRVGRRLGEDDFGAPRP